MIEKSKKKRQVTVVALVTALCLLGDSMLYIALPIFYKEVGLQSLWEVGLILSINRFVRIPINPLVGLAYRKLPLRAGLFISVILAIVTTIGYGVGTGLVIWIILRLVWGVAWSFLRLGGLLAVIEASTDRNRGELMGRYNGLYRLGSLGGMIGGGVLVATIGFDWTSILFGICMIAGLPLVYFALPKVVHQDEWVKTNSTPKESLRFSRRTISVVISGMILAFLIQGMFNSSLSLIMSDHFGEQLTIVGLVVGVTALAGILQGVRWVWEPYLAVKIGKWSDGDKGRLPLFLTALGVSVLGFLLIPFSLPFFIWVFVAIGIMISSTALTTLIDALTSDVTRGEDANQVMTTYTVFLDLGAALGPLVSYILFSLGGSVSHVFFGAVFVYLSLFIYWVRVYKKGEFTPVQHTNTSSL
ncbi:probable MFS transporter [Halalkalibacter wakoensis JCM 9140]|uniref:Probable MFS transporter n=1 Tax=Halalkalibacter wakoensis JCM 9140 TaxID=1236970 RepID=W4Q417_9BACI|nr:MFS transporter [Halalkalibacter wakoensis]GAE26433.1 probable MFS transporter [Halalkalibacter wakoensis JCM 9140]